MILKSNGLIVIKYLKIFITHKIFSFMPRILLIILTVIFFFSPLFVFAQNETPETTPDFTPIYLFADENGGILGIAPITDELCFWVYATSTEYSVEAIVQSTAIVQLLDYYPFGDVRIDQKETSFSEKRQFTGHEFDSDTDLIYMGSRYYPGTIARFLSQDPAYLAVGDTQKLKEITNLQLQKYLENPQNLNSYSYTINNPLKHVDKKGEFWDTVIDVGFIAYDLYKIGEAAFTGGNVKSELANLGLDVGGAVVPFVTGLGMARRTAQIADKTGDAAKAINKTDNITKGSKSIFSRTAEHAQKHYPNLSKSQLENLARQTKANADIKIEIGGKTPKTYYYNSKTNDLFIDNVKQPTIFQPDKGVNYLNEAIQKDIQRGGVLK